MCRSRRELSNDFFFQSSPFSQSSFQIDPNSNEYLLAKIGVDTPENEPLEVWGKNSIQYSLHSLLVNRRQRQRPVGCIDSKKIPRTSSSNITTTCPFWNTVFSLTSLCSMQSWKQNSQSSWLRGSLLRTRFNNIE